jgi:hypothetical protein
LSKKPIRVYWWQPGASGRINLGDEITRAIVETVFERPVERAELADCEMVAIGSLLQIAVRNNLFATRVEPIHVWGTGLIGPREISARKAKYIYHAVRGPLTRCLVEAPATLPLGDPGLLADRVWAPCPEKRHAWGIIPHYSQIKHPEIERLHQQTPNSALVDVTDPDIARTMCTISACDRILSTSLHGLILADVYRVPNYWLDVGVDASGGSSWKFYDYFASVGRARFEPLRSAELVQLDRHRVEALDLAHFDQVNRRQQMLLLARPDL